MLYKCFLKYHFCHSSLIHVDTHKSEIKLEALRAITAIPIHVKVSSHQQIVLCQLTA